MQGVPHYVQFIYLFVCMLACLFAWLQLNVSNQIKRDLDDPSPVIQHDYKTNYKPDVEI